MCRFTFRNGTYRNVERAVSCSQTAHIAKSDAVFVKTFRATALSVPYFIASRSVNFHGSGDRWRECGHWHYDCPHFANLEVHCPLLFQRQCKREARELALICPSAAWLMQRRRQVEALSNRFGRMRIFILIIVATLLPHGFFTLNALPDGTKGVSLHNASYARE